MPRFHIESKGGNSLAFIEAHNHATAAVRYFQQFGDMVTHLAPALWQQRIGTELDVQRGSGEQDKDGTFYLVHEEEVGVWRTVSHPIAVKLVTSTEEELE